MPTTATDTIEQLAPARIQVRLRHRRRAGHRAARPRRGRRSASSRPRRTSRSGMLEWRLKAYRHWLTMTRAAPGPTSTTRRSTTRRSSTTRRRSRRRTARRASTRSTPSSSRPTRSSASRCASRRCSPASRSTRCSTASRWPPPSRTSSAEVGIIFCSFSEAVREHPELVQKYLGSVVPLHRQLLRHAQLGGVHRRLVRLHPEGRALPDGAVDLLPHQRQEHRAVRAHADHRRRGRLRQLPRGLHRADARREPAPRRGGRAGRARERADQVLDGAELVPGRRGRARAASTTSSPSAASARARNSKISWTQVETGSAITWKYPSVILKGDDSVGEFYSVALTNNHQQADTGTKMIHIGKNTRTTIVSKGISAGHGQNTYRGHGEDPQGRRRRAQLLAVRLDADRRRVRRAHLPLHRRAEPDRAAWSTRPRPRRSARTRSSTATSAASRPRTRCR